MTKRSYSILVGMVLLFLDSSAMAQSGVYECMEQQASGQAQCDEFSATNDEHVAAGRATRSSFGTYRTVGTGERLGFRTGSVVSTLFAIGNGSFSTDRDNCPVSSMPWPDVANWPG